MSASAKPVAGPRWTDPPNSDAEELNDVTLIATTDGGRRSHKPCECLDITCPPNKC